MGKGEFSIVVLVIFIGFVYVICTHYPPNDTSNHNINKEALIITKSGVERAEWGYVKSPSGKCYEVLKGIGPKGFSYLGMSRVPRTFCEKPSKQKN